MIDYTNEKLKYYYKMLRIRMVEESIAEKYTEQEMRCPVHLSIGQEAIAVGVCAALDNDDYVMSTHRAHAHYLAKGGNLNKMLAEIYGKKTGCSSGIGGSMHLIDLTVNFLGSTPIVGGTIPIAVGTSFASKYKKTNRVSVVFFGEATTEEGIFMESINFAALKNLSIIFICENNLYSVYSPLSVRQPEGRSRVKIAEAHGITSYEADGNDVRIVYERVKDAVEKCKAGLGPIYLDFETYRWREHCGPNYDNDLGYRSLNEFNEWKKKCPVEKEEKILFDRNEIDENMIRGMREKINLEIEEALDFARSSPFPEYDDLMSLVYAK